MKVVIKVIFITSVVVILIPALTLASFACVTYFSNSTEIEKIIDSSDVENRSPSKLVKRYIQASFDTTGKPSWPVARMLASKFGYSQNVSPIRWQFNWFVWYLVTEFVIDESDAFTLFCTLAYNGEGYGLNSLSTRLFDKPMSALSATEVAELLAYERAPNYFARRKSALERYKNMLMQRVKNI